MDLETVRQHLFDAGHARSAAALVSDGDQVLEVSVTPGVWVTRSHSTEWRGANGTVRCWQVLNAGAREIPADRPGDWVHPAVGMLWPHLLPVWGREEDGYRPARLIEGYHGPRQLVLEATTGDVIGGLRLDAGGSLDLDPQRWLCTRLELAGSVWQLDDYRLAPPRTR